MKTELNNLKNHILSEIHKHATKEIAKIALNYRINGQFDYEYYKSIKIESMLTALKVIDEKEYEQFFSELLNIKTTINNIEFVICVYDKKENELKFIEYGDNLPF